MTIAITIISYSSSGFVPSIVAGVLYGIATIALYDKAVRNNLFLPYFYLGSGALLYGVAEAFQVVWARYFADANKFSLVASAFSTTVGTCFILFALFRLLELWYKVGLRPARINVKPQRIYSRGTLVISLLILLTTLIMLTGDILLADEHKLSDGSDNDTLFWVGLRFKTAGSVLVAVLDITYLSIVFFLTLQRAQKTDQNNYPPINKSLAFVLALIGVLAFIRYVFFVYLIISSGALYAYDEYDQDMKRSIVWPYLVGLIQAPTLLLFLTAVLYDLTKVRQGVEIAKQQGYIGVGSSVETA